MTHDRSLPQVVEADLASESQDHFVQESQWVDFHPGQAHYRFRMAQVYLWGPSVRDHYRFQMAQEYLWG